MKRAIISALAGLFFGAACVMSGAVQAQTLLGQSQFGPNQTVDLYHAQMVDMTPGAQRVTDANGFTKTGVFPNDADFYMGDFFARYVNLPGTYLYYNVTQTTGTTCVSNNSVVGWLVTGTKTLNDGCAFFNAVNGRSRR